ncbi:hypothetical protein EVAR_37535_1 [Eumeta japonica]|uniref:Uncharacterized protein n=1 Tax=Eumeta variegata TaxID=151549 RepID=A0A4C1XSP5_EUMVA|nr:hypothetical protein EVAR_37535_1 [Eumeta japonica]
MRECMRPCMRTNDVVKIAGHGCLQVALVRMSWKSRGSPTSSSGRSMAETLLGRRGRNRTLPQAINRQHTTQPSPGAFTISYTMGRVWAGGGRNGVTEGSGPPGFSLTGRNDKRKLYFTSISCENVSGRSDVNKGRAPAGALLFTSGAWPRWPPLAALQKYFKFQIRCIDNAFLTTLYTEN